MAMLPRLGIIADVAAGVPQMLWVADNSIMEATVPERFVGATGTEVDLARNRRFIRADNGPQGAGSVGRWDDFAGGRGAAESCRSCWCNL